MPPKKAAAATKTTAAKTQKTGGEGAAKTEAKKAKKAVEPSEDTVKKPAKPRAKRGVKAVSEEEKEIIEVAQNDNKETDQKSSGVKKAVKRKATPKEGPKEEPKAEPKAKAPARNPTVTNWDAINVKCTAKTPKGKASNFQIVSWNVDGLRAWIKKGGLDVLDHVKPDILCLQEIKCDEEKLPEEVTTVEGYESLWCCSQKQGYAGVGILSKVKPRSVVYGIGSEDHDDEGRCITAEYDKFYVVNVYVPNAGRKLVTLPKRLEWNKLFKQFIKKLDAKKPVILCGDMNVAHNEIDLANPKTNTKNAGFTIQEREGLTDFLEAGYVDTFRQLYPDKEKAYTFWTYMSGARAKNVGWRLDYFIVSKRFLENVCDNVIQSEVLGSDHCPLVLYVNV